jgi:hypothetical protein
VETLPEGVDIEKAEEKKRRRSLISDVPGNYADDELREYLLNFLSREGSVPNPSSRATN